MSREMVAIGRFFGILLQKWRLTKQGVRVLTERNDFPLVFRIIPAIDDIGDFLSTADGHKLFLHIA